MEKTEMKRILVSDRTLCDGAVMREQGLSFRERANVAEALFGLGVDAVELPEITRPREETVINRTISLAAGEVMVKIPVGLTEESVTTAYESVREAKRPCLQVVLPVSTLQMEYRCHKKARGMLEVAESLFRAAKARCETVELVAEDASRADAPFLASLIEKAKACGVTSVTLCDDAGIWLPCEAKAAVKDACETGIAVSVRPSSKIGMAAAVALAAVRAGAGGVVTTVSGDGLTSAAFSDLVRARGEEIGVSCGLRETGIHSDLERLKSGLDAGAAGASSRTDARIRLTGDATLREVAAACISLGYELSDSDLGEVHREVQRVGAKKEQIGTRELEAIVATAAMQVPSTYHLESYVVSSGNVISAMAQLTLTYKDRTLSGVSMGDGPIDAAFRAIEQIAGHRYELDDFQIQSVTSGKGAVGSALVKLRQGGKLYSGQGISTDIIGASIRAYLNALNKIIYEEA
ncbi:MAG: alpha-isopropylmalate synthase regulatory domain-containing protein [Eubacteriales bacterium]